MHDLGTIIALNKKSTGFPKHGRSERELDRSLKHLKLALRHAGGSWLSDAIRGFVQRLSLFVSSIKGLKRGQRR